MDTDPEGLRATETPADEAAPWRGEPGPKGLPTGRGTIPPEVMRFLGQPQAESLLVRGFSGTGKTTFALSALVRFAGRRVFVSCRLQGNRLRSYFPWVAEPRYQIEIVEVDPRENIRGNLAELSRDVRWPHSRIGTDGVYDHWKWLPTPLRTLWQSLTPETPALVVIDSWDGLVETFLGPPATGHEHLPGRPEVERTLLRSMGLVNAHLLLVVERNAASSTDYLVDGIVDLETRLRDGRLERWICIPKLRGVQVDEPEYPFTLDGGDFDIVPALTEGRPSAALRAEEDPAPVSGFLWPGSSDFVDAFGRLPVGHMSLVEIDEGVSAAGMRCVLVPMVDGVLRAGGRVLLSLPPTLRVREFWDVMRERFDPVGPPGRFRIIASGPEASVAEEFEGAVLQLPGDAEKHSPVFPETLEFARRPLDGRSGNGAFHWHTGLRLLVQSTGRPYTLDTAPRVAQQYLQDAPLHLMIIGQDGDPIFRSLGEMATTQLRFQDRAGRIFVCGVRPRTHSYALTDGFGQAPYRLVRVV